MWLFMRIKGYIRLSCVIIYRFLLEKGDERGIVNHISKELRQIKTSQYSFTLLHSPAVCINHSLIFPACLQGLSAQAPEPSLWHPSDLSLFHVNAHSQLQHFRPAFRLRVVSDVQNGAEIYCEWWKSSTNLWGQWLKWAAYGSSRGVKWKKSVSEMKSMSEVVLMEKLKETSAALYLLRARRQRI